MRGRMIKKTKIPIYPYHTKKGSKCYNSAIWNVLCSAHFGSAWILKGLNLDVNTHTPWLMLTLTIFSLRIQLIMDWGLNNERGLSRAILFSPVSRSKGRTSRAYWDIPFGKGQTRYPVSCLLSGPERSSKELYSPYKDNKQLPKNPPSV